MIGDFKEIYSLIIIKVRWQHLHFDKFSLSNKFIVDIVEVIKDSMPLCYTRMS